MNRLLQALIALSGLAITGLLTWQGLENDKAQTRLSLLSLFSEQVGVAVSTCSPTTLVMATDAATQLGDEKYLDYLAQVSAEVDDCSNREQTTPPRDQTNDPPGPTPDGGSSGPSVLTAPVLPQQQQLAMASRNVDLRRREGLARPATQAAGEQRWYTVIATYDLNETATAAEHVRALMPRLQRWRTPARLEVYRTSVSPSSLAIVLTPERADREGTRDLLALARRLGARNPFTQQDNGWRLCEAPQTTEGLQRCAAGR